MNIGVIGGADGPTAIYLTSSLWGGPLLIIGVLLVVGAYFLGNVSPAILIGRMHGIDIKKEGSGNAGTTNVLRVLGKKAAVATLVIDILKGVISVSAARLVGTYLVAPEVGALLAMLCGLATFCGHIWPILFKFKGGKGVATAFGVLLAFKPLLGLTALAVVLVTVAITRKVSLGSVIGAISLPFLAGLLFPITFENQFMDPYMNRIYIGWTVIMAIIVLIKHRANIVRLIKGEEPNISFKK